MTTQEKYSRMEEGQVVKAMPKCGMGSEQNLQLNQQCQRKGLAQEIENRYLIAFGRKWLRNMD